MSWKPRYKIALPKFGIVLSPQLRGVGATNSPLPLINRGGKCVKSSMTQPYTLLNCVEIKDQNDCSGRAASNGNASLTVFFSRYLFIKQKITAQIVITT